MKPLDVQLLRKISFNLNCRDLAARFGRDVKTIARWLRTGIVPRDVAALIPIYAGFMPWPGFDGFRVVDESIVIPEWQHTVSPQQLRALPFLFAERDALRRERDRYRATPAQYLLDL